MIGLSRWEKAHWRKSQETKLTLILSLEKNDKIIHFLFNLSQNHSKIDHLGIQLRVLYSYFFRFTSTDYYLKFSSSEQLSSLSIMVTPNFLLLYFFLGRRLIPEFALFFLLKVLETIEFYELVAGKNFYFSAFWVAASTFFYLRKYFCCFFSNWSITFLRSRMLNYKRGYNAGSYYLIILMVISSLFILKPVWKANETVWILQ